jgi:hypothetical protein
MRRMVRRCRPDASANSVRVSHGRVVDVVISMHLILTITAATVVDRLVSQGAATPVASTFAAATAAG